MNIKDLVIDLDTIVQCGENETVGSALSLVERSHQPIFVFNKKKNFLGLISPFEVLFRRRLPYTTKVSSALIMPPKFTSDSSLYEMIDFMLSSRIYTIPIFDKDEVKLIGQIQLSTVFNNLLTDKELLTQISKVIQVNQPITINQDAKINKAYQLLRQKEISRIIIIDKKDKVTGIVSRSDIEQAFIGPTPKQRSSSRGGQPVNYSFEDENIKRIDEPVKSYRTDRVSKINDSKNMIEKTKALIKSKLNDLIVVNKDEVPVGIITSRDLLLALSKLKPQEQINIVFENPSSSVSDEDINEAHTILHTYGKKINKREPLDRIKISFEEPKSSHGDTILFNTTLKMFCLDGSYYVATTKELEFLEGVRSATEQVSKQIRRDSANKHR